MEIFNTIKVEKTSWDSQNSRAIVEFNMGFNLAQFAYNIGSNRILNPLTPTSEENIYKNVFDIELNDSSGNPVNFEVEIISRKPQNPRQLQLQIKILEDVEEGTLTLINRNNGLLRGNSGPDNVFFGDVTITPVTAQNNAGGAALESINSFSAPAMKSATMLTMIISISSSIALVKIF